MPLISRLNSEHLLFFGLGERNVQHRVKAAAIKVAVEADTRNMCLQLLCHVQAHAVDILLCSFKVFGGQFQCFGKTHDAVQILRCCLRIFLSCEPP